MLRRALAFPLFVLVLVLALPSAASAQVEGQPGEARLPVPGLDHPVRVIRDVDGIAHLSAVGEHDLFLAQGWIHAEDRLFQMDALRRQASGILAELLGDAALASDVELRTVGLRRAAAASWPALSADTQAALEAYAAGVNAWVASHPLPPEYGLLELTSFEPWTPVDSLVIAKAIAFSLSFDLDVDLTVTLGTYQAAGAQLGFDGSALFFEDLFRSAPFDPASTVPDAGAAATAAAARTAPAPRAVPRVAAATRLLGERVAERWSRVPFLAGALHPRERRQGSNEWAVSGSHTASGLPLLANDPHLALDFPATFYPIHLRAAPVGYNVAGQSFAGVPFVILGHNQWVMWGATTNPLDVTDTFQEQVVPDPASPSGLATLYQGVPEPILAIPELFRVNAIGDGVPDNLQVVPPGGAIPAATLIVPRRNHGPIIALDTGSGAALSVQYAGFGATREAEAFHLWNRARDLADFRAGLERFDFGSQNWAYADVAGNVAYFTSGEMPLREDLEAGTVTGLPPYLIRDGQGGNEWIPQPDPPPGQALPYAVLPAAEMPHVVNPAHGFFVNANNDPAGTTLDNDPLNQLRPGGGIYYLNPGYDLGTRAGRITQALAERLAAGPVTRADMQAIQADVTLLDAQVLVPYILASFDHAEGPSADPVLAALAADPRIAEAVGRLADWDFTTPTGIAEGYDASDVDGVLAPPGDAEVEASVAATIYSLWRGRMIANTIDATLAGLGGLPAPGSAQAMTALRHLLDGFDAGGGVGASGVDFFVVPGVADPAARRDVVLLRSLADALDLLAGAAFEPAFGGSTDQRDYRWGRLHRLVLDHPLGAPLSVPPALGLFPPPLPDLAGIPVDGGFGTVDASSHSARADGAEEFRFGSGPVRRFVGEAAPHFQGITAVSALPGGTSGIPGDPASLALLPRWLTNDTYPVRLRFADVKAGQALRQVLMPASP